MRTRVFYGSHGLRAGWRLLIFFSILSVTFSLVAEALRLLPHHTAQTGRLTPTATLLSEAIPLLIVLVATWIMARIERRTWTDFGLPLQGAFGTKFWQGAIVGYASISVLLGSLRIAGAFRLNGIALQGIEPWKYAMLWGSVFVIVGLFEESFFRGYCLFTLASGIGFWPAAIFLSLAFGYVHHGNSGETWVGAFAAGLVGLLFCLLLRRTGDLWMPIGFHAAWDWGETYFYGVPDSGQVATGHLFNANFSGPQWLTGGTVGPEGSYFCIALLVVLLLAFALLFREAKYPHPPVVSASHPGGPPIAGLEASHHSRGTQEG